MNQDQADIVITWINALEEQANTPSIVERLQREGFTEKEIDDALRALGALAGRDCGLL